MRVNMLFKILFCNLKNNSHIFNCKLKMRKFVSYFIDRIFTKANIQKMTYELLTICLNIEIPNYESEYTTLNYMLQVKTLPSYFQS